MEDPAPDRTDVALEQAALRELRTTSTAGHPSLEGMHSTVSVPHHQAGFWEQWRAFVGPAILISVGYMDPGNWGTDLQAGAQFKYDLLWVVGLASLMAIFMQVISARLGVVTGKDLAQCCRDWYPRWTRWPNWLLSELAIAACDLAEVLGQRRCAEPAVPHSAVLGGHHHRLDVLLLLGLQSFGMRTIEAVVLVLIGTIAVCYFIEIFVLPQTQPSFLEMGRALISPHFRQAGMLYVAIGIIGATVMPHNLVPALGAGAEPQAAEGRALDAERHPLQHHRLGGGADHRLLRKLRDPGAGGDGVFRQSERYAVPAARSCSFSADSDWIRVAYLTLAPLLGTVAASTLFAVALLASGQSSTITGTLAGQVVMEGFMHWRIKPWLRRLITRTLAILPAVFVIGMRGDSSVTDLLTLSQVVLALQLPFAMFPLLQFTSSRRRMGKWKNGWFLLSAGWASAILITAMDVFGLPESLKISVAGHRRRVTPRLRNEPPCTTPSWSRSTAPRPTGPSSSTSRSWPSLAHSRLVLLHVADGWAARTYGPDAVSPEISEDLAYLESVRTEFEAAGIPRRSRSWRMAIRRRKSSSGCSKRAATWLP